VVVAKVRDGKAEEGFNALTASTKPGRGRVSSTRPRSCVRRFQNASSIASLLLTTEALVSEIPRTRTNKGAGGGRWRDGRHGGGMGATKPSPQVQPQET